MFKRIDLFKTEDYFINLSNRTNKGVYFCRINFFNSMIENFLLKYLEETKRNGIYIKEKIQNPNESQLAFFEEIIGFDFELDIQFFDNVLSKWLPRLNVYQKNCISTSLYDVLNKLKQAGKNENILKNIYIKFMCWFYYKFERIMGQLGNDNIPKILYEGYVTNHELKFLSILSLAGCDILLLQTEGDEQYLKIDCNSNYTQAIKVLNGVKFQKGFSVLNLKRQDENKISIPKIDTIIKTNVWISGDVFSSSLINGNERGNKNNCFHNIFVKIRGVESKESYYSDLFKWKSKLESNKRKVVIIQKAIEPPTNDEVKSIKTAVFSDYNHMITYLINNTSFIQNVMLESIIKKSFVEVMEDEKNSNLQQVKNKAVSLLCWLKRYIPVLFENYSINAVPTFIYYGVCRNINEVYFIKLLSKIPVDVFVVCPDLNMKCKLEDKILFEKVYDNSLPLNKFPTSIDNVDFSTVAYNAERDLDNILYQDTFLYRNKQFKKAMPITLKTTFEEIEILWNQEAKYRPNFEILDDRVILPVIFSKVSGVPNNDKNAYINFVSKLINDDTVIIKRLPYIRDIDENPIKKHAALFLNNGKLQVEKIKNHPDYRYAFMREDMQDYMFDKLQLLIDKRIINGTLSNGIEYTIISTILNLNKTILRLIQKYDFTKEIPKVIIVHSDESSCSIEDSIVVAFLNLVGFDIVMFAPSGYQCVERFFAQRNFVEYQVGQYIYDLKVSEIKKKTSKYSDSIIDKLFRR